VKMQAGITRHGFGLTVHPAVLTMVPAGVRRELSPLRQGSAPVPWAVGLVLGAVERAGPGLLPGPPRTHVPGSGLPVSSSSSTSRQREEEREGETLETTQTKTRESKMRAVGGNADVLQAYSRLGDRHGEALSGTGWRRCCEPGPLRTHQGCASWPQLGVQATFPASHPSHQPPMAPTSSPQPVPSRTAAFPARQARPQCMTDQSHLKIIPLTQGPNNPHTPLQHLQHHLSKTKTQL